MTSVSVLDVRPTFPKHDMANMPLDYSELPRDVGLRRSACVHNSNGSDYVVSQFRVGVPHPERRIRAPLFVSFSGVVRHWRNVFPRFSIYSTFHGHARYAVSFRQRRNTLPARYFGSNICHRLVGEFCVWVGLSVGRYYFTMPALGAHVAHVIGLGSKKEMGGIATRWVVAAVKDEQPVLDGSAGENPRHSVCQNLFLIRAVHAISVFVFRVLPRPAVFRVGYGHPVPEACACGSIHMRVV